MKVARILVVLAVCAITLEAGTASAAIRTGRVSVSTAGVQGDSDSSSPAISADGRFVAFESAATNLVPGDTNGYMDVFVRDRKLHTTELVSVTTAGIEGDGGSGAPAISANGRFVAFESAATNLVPGDTNGYMDVFVRDRKLHTTELVSTSAAGTRGDGNSSLPAISSSGRYVAFESAATNLVRHDTNGHRDVFVRDRSVDKTARASVSTARIQGARNSFYPAISSSGRFVAFVSFAKNLVRHDTNGHRDVFVRDRSLHKTVRVSVSTTGIQGDGDSGSPAISADGRFVAFDSSANNLVPGDRNGPFLDVFVRDRKLHKTAHTAWTSESNCRFPSISADGRFVTFDVGTSNVYETDAVILRDRKLHSWIRVDVDTAGHLGNEDSSSPAISADGRFVAFESLATNLAPSDTNASLDVFVRGPYG